MEEKPFGYHHRSSSKHVTLPLHPHAATIPYSTTLATDLLVHPELSRNVLLHDTRLLRELPRLLCGLHLLVVLEMGDILRMRQVLLLDVIPAVVFFPVVNLILVLGIAVVSRSHAKVRELDVLGVALHELYYGNLAVLVDIEHVEDGLHDRLFLGLGYRGCRGIGQSVCAPDVGCCPDAGAVVVVKREEGRRVVPGNMMLLCCLSAAAAGSGVCHSIRTSHVSCRPVRIWRDYNLRVFAAAVRRDIEGAGEQQECAQRDLG
jgi:hypothetical protein